MPFQLQLVLEVLSTVVAEGYQNKDHISDEVVEVDVVVQMCKDIGLLLDHSYGQL